MYFDYPDSTMKALENKIMSKKYTATLFQHSTLYFTSTLVSLSLSLPYRYQ